MGACGFMTGEDNDDNGSELYGCVDVSPNDKPPEPPLVATPWPPAAPSPSCSCPASAIIHAPCLSNARLSLSVADQNSLTFCASTAQQAEGLFWRQENALRTETETRGILAHE